MVDFKLLINYVEDEKADCYKRILEENKKELEMKAKQKTIARIRSKDSHKYNVVIPQKENCALNFSFVSHIRLKRCESMKTTIQRKVKPNTGDFILRLAKTQIKRALGYRQISLFERMDRIKVRVEFAKLVDGKIPTSEFNKYFDVTYRKVSQVFNNDIPVFEQARHMAIMVDSILDMKTFLESRGKKIDLNKIRV